jgi:hypothetical protein
MITYSIASIAGMTVVDHDRHRELERLEPDRRPHQHAAVEHHAGERDHDERRGHGRDQQQRAVPLPRVEPPGPVEHI